MESVAFIAVVGAYWDGVVWLDRPCCLFIGVVFDGELSGLVIGEPFLV